MKMMKRRIWRSWRLRQISLAIVFGCSAPGVDAQVITAEVGEQVKQRINDFYTRNRLVSIAVVVFEGENLTLKHARGYADKNRRIKATTEHIYTLASVTKPITSSTLLNLQANGFLALDDAAARYIDGFPDGFTLRDLLNHTTGFIRENENEKHLSNSDYRSVVEYLPRRYQNRKHRYANVNYAAAGAAIAAAAGVSFRDAAARYFTEVTGEALYFLNDDGVQRGRQFVKNYVRKRRRHYPHKPVTFGLWEPAALAQCSPEALARFIRAQMRPGTLRVLQENAVVIRDRTYPSGTQVRESYALGFRLQHIDDKLVRVYHNGFIYGVLSAICYYTDIDMGVVALSNMSTYPRRRLSLSRIPGMVEMAVDDAFTHDVADYALLHGENSALQYIERNADRGSLREDVLARLADELSAQDEIRDALILLRLNNQVFPTSATTYMQLGEAYAQSGESEDAIRVLRDGLEISPNHRRMQDLLRTISGSRTWLE